jgi:hypothetical protein
VPPNAAQEPTTPSAITISSVRPGRIDAWRAFYEDLRGARRADWAQSQRRHGIRREAVWLVEDREQPLVVVLREGSDPEGSLQSLAASDHPFDLWFRERLSELTTTPETGMEVFDSRPRPGSWRGLTGWRRR